MTQKELAKRVECSWQHLSDIKRGRKFMSWSLAERLEKETNISACEWMRPKAELWKMVKSL